METLDAPAAPPNPQLCAVAIVANECDIIETFTRHTLSFVDHLHVLLHNSYDSSRRILENLAAEGMPVSFDVEATPVYARERMVNAFIHRIADGSRYDYLLPLDADEFIVAGSRAELEAELARVPVGGSLSLAWLPYVPTEHDDAADPNPVTRIRHRLSTPHPRYRKVFFAATLLAHEDVYLADGNHKLLSRTGREIPERATRRVFLAHYPVRSSPQLASKVVIGSIARRMSAQYTDDRSQHWRSLMSDRALSTDLPMEGLTRIAMRYLGAKDTQLVDAPLATSARSLKYPELIRVNAFERLSAFVVAALTEQDAGVRSEPVEQNGRQALLKEVEGARHIVQQLHEELHAAKRKTRIMVRAAKWKARLRTTAAIGGIFLMAAAAAYFHVR